MIHRSFALILMVFQVISAVRAATPPGDISDCLVEYSKQNASAIATSLVLYRGDGTFQELDSQIRVTGQKAFTSQPLIHGTYTYRADLNAGSAELSTHGNIEQAPFTLIFETAVSGTYVSGPLNHFRIYRRVAHDGFANVSTRSWISPGRVAITGMIVPGPDSRWVLIRAVGPSLKSFGVQTAISEPQLSLHSGFGYEVGTYSPWMSNKNLTQGFLTSFILAGAFPLAENSKDIAALVHLDPGAYTLLCSSVADGEALVEAYILPCK